MAALSRCLANGSLSLLSPPNKHHRSRLRILSGVVRSSSTDSNKLNLSCNDLKRWNSGSLSLDERWRDRGREDEGRRKETGKVQCSAGLEGIGGRVARERGGVAISERTKVVAMMALVMLLCNADRVVMSVAVVPLAAQYGWSSSFVGIVQVCTFFLCYISNWCLVGSDMWAH